MKILRPTFLINENTCRENISKMARKAAKSNCIFRPHFKTHQSAQIGAWFREFGVERITVSSVGMAQYFALHHWNDILIAFPFNIHETETINELANRITLSLTIESDFHIEYLANHIKSPVGIYIKIDAGYHRTGLSANDHSTIDSILSVCKSNPVIRFKGFLSHFGNTYQSRGADEVNSTFSKSMAKLKSLQNKYIHQFPDLLISIGDTPSCSLVDDLSDADEIRPGNFIFYDLMQLQIGSCSFSDISSIIVCPVVAKHPERSELVIYGGAVHLSKDFITDENGQKTYGRIVFLKKDGWSDSIEGSFLSNLSQEHGIVTCSEDLMNSTEIGDLLGILPVHSCLSANLFNSYLTIKGETVQNIHSF